MKERFWTERRDRLLIALQEGGQSASQIAEQVDATRNAVIARSNRIRGVKFPCDVARLKGQRELARQKRAEQKARDKAALAKMRTMLQSSADPRSAISAALKAGASGARIARALGISKQRIHQIVNKPLSP